MNGQMAGNSGIKLIQPGNIGKMMFINTEFRYLSETAFNELGCTEIHGGYLLINRILNDGMKACIFPPDKERTVASVDVCSIAPTEFYSIDYLLLAVSSPDFQRAVYENSSGAMMKRINKGRLVKIPFPLPPLKEQKRIASAAYSIFEQLDILKI